MPFQTHEELDADAAGVGGSDTQVQFNDGGAFAGNAGLTFDKNTATLTATNLAGSGAGITGVDADTLDGNAASAFAASSHTHGGGDITSAVANANDADTVDGQHAAAFAAASHQHAGADITSAVANATASADGVTTASGTAPLTLSLAAKALSGSVATATTDAVGVVELATDGENAADKVVQGNDARLSNARTPTAHNLIDTTGHPVSGLTTGHFLKATGATTYGFGAHGLTAADVGAAASSHAHSGGDITSGIVDELYGGTGQDSFTTGDTLYASATNTLAKRAIGNEGDVFTVASGVPTWAAPAAGGQMTYDAIVAPSGGDYTTVGAAVAAGKYRLFIKNGTYTETGIELGAGVDLILVGESRDGVILNYTTGSAKSYLLSSSGELLVSTLTIKVSFVSTASYYITSASSSGQSVLFENVLFVMNAKPADGKYLHYHSGVWQVGNPYALGLMDRCVFDFITNIPGTNWATMTAVYGASVRDSFFFSDNKFGVMKITGVYSNNSAQITGNAFYGLNVGVASHGTNVVISGNAFYACSTGVDDNTSYTVVTGNNFHQTLGYGYDGAGAGSATVTGNAFISWNLNYTQVKLGTASVLTGNYLRNLGANVALIVAAGNNSVVVGNSFYGTGEVTDNGTNTLFQGNYGFPDKNVNALVQTEANTAGSGTPNVLLDTESGKLLTNEGSTAQNYHTLPTAVAGLRFEFTVQDADGIRVVANTGDTIRIATSVSPAAGYIESTTIGDSIELTALNATEWVATKLVGAGWAVST